MSRKRSKRPTAKSADTLARLRRLYSHQPQLQYNEFGRRIALPSEVAAQIKQLKPASNTP